MDGRPARRHGRRGRGRRVLHPRPAAGDAGRVPVLRLPLRRRARPAPGDGGVPDREPAGAPPGGARRPRARRPVPRREARGRAEPVSAWRPHRTRSTPRSTSSSRGPRRSCPQVERTKHVHGLHPYLGKFVPQLVEIFLAPLLRAGRPRLRPVRRLGHDARRGERVRRRRDRLRHLGVQLPADAGQDGALLARRARAGAARRARGGARRPPRPSAATPWLERGTRRARSASCSPTARPSRRCRSRTPTSAASCSRARRARRG